jgi:hypothetical protein
MIKPGKVCSQLMNANNTGETEIKVVGNIFRLTFVFNALKTPLNLYFNSLISLILFFIFKIRGVLTIKACIEGGNLVNLTIHALFIMGCPFNILSNHMQGQAWGAAKAFFCRSIMEACEAR